MSKPKLTPSGAIFPQGDESKYEPLTKEEKEAIATLEKLAENWPQSLWLYSASGTLNVMKKHEGLKALKAAGRGGFGEYVHPGFSVVDIDIENDGGDW
jgi:hypothetical protein